MTTNDAIDGLNGLLQVSKDGEKGYLAAAAQVHNSELRTIFENYAKERANFAKQLHAEVVRLGGSPAEAGSLSGTLHRGWMDLTSAVTGGSAANLVASCETGDENAVAQYERFVDTDVTGQSRALAEKQLQQMRESHNRLLRLRGELESGTEYPANIEP